MKQNSKQTHDKNPGISAGTLSLTAMFAALVLLATSVLKIPTPTFGYIHIGDTFVLLSGIFLGPIWGSLAAGIGSGLSDLLGGYIVWVPGTFIIKYLTAMTAAILFRSLSNRAFRKAPHTPAVLLAGIAGETVMVIGYFFYNIIIVSFTNGSLGGAGIAAAAAASLAEIPFNLVQGGAGILLALLLNPLISRVPMKSLSAVKQ